jgi:hypothetical protein
MDSNTSKQRWVSISCVIDEILSLGFVMIMLVCTNEYGMVLPTLYREQNLAYFGVYLVVLEIQSWSIFVGQPDIIRPILKLLAGDTYFFDCN